MDTPKFTVGLRGYQREQVDALIQQGTRVLASSDAQRRAAVRDALREPTLQIAMRGYDRQQVDTYLTRIVDQLE